MKANFHHFSKSLVLMLIRVKVDLIVYGLVIVSNHAYLLKCALTLSSNFTATILSAYGVNSLFIAAGFTGINHSQWMTLNPPPFYYSHIQVLIPTQTTVIILLPQPL